MKRTPMPERRSPMGRSAMARRSRPLAQRSESKAREDRERARLKADRRRVAGDRCEAIALIRVVDPSHRCFGVLDLHEVKTRARGGSAVDPDNQLLPCRSCHGWIDDHPRLARDLGLLRNSWDA